MENETCIGCKWNNYPECNGTIINGEKMKIDNLRPIFNCGVKDRDEPEIINYESKSELEILQEKINALENRMKKLEAK